MTEREEQAVIVLNTLYSNPLLSDIHRQALQVGVMAIMAVSSSEKPNKSEIPTGWIPVNQPPKASGRYLVTTRFLKHSQIEMADYATDLHKVDEYDFPKHEAGWYRYDSEYGHYAIDNVIAWMPLPEKYTEEGE